MRDATGNIIEVRTIAPWGLHRLTATGSNADARHQKVMRCCLPHPSR